MSLVMSRACAHIDACSWAMFYRIAFLICAVNPIVCLVVSKVVPHMQTSSQTAEEIVNELISKEEAKIASAKKGPGTVEHQEAEKTNAYKS